jgi:hypothetical protein
VTVYLFRNPRRPPDPELEARILAAIANYTPDLRVLNQTDPWNLSRNTMPLLGNAPGPIPLRDHWQYLAAWRWHVWCYLDACWPRRAAEWWWHRILIGKNDDEL